jgi:hypothetical protein
MPAKKRAKPLKKCKKLEKTRTLTTLADKHKDW